MKNRTDTTHAYAEPSSDLALICLSHEIKNFVQSILGVSQVLKRGCASREHQEYIQLMQNSGTVLLDILKSVMHHSDPEQALFQPHGVCFQIHKVAERIQQYFRVLAREKSLDFCVVVDKTARGYFWGDETKFVQIVYNLVSNAFNFTAEGFVLVKFSQVGLSHDQPILRVDVVDSGPGIPGDQQAKLFKGPMEPHARKDYHGNGLGLFICGQLAQILNGRIGFEDKAETGAHFWFEIPVIWHDKENLKNVSPRKCFTPMNLKILLAEDRLVNQKILKFLLEELGCVVDVAANGAEALEKITASMPQSSLELQYNLIILDQNMPLMNGSDVALHLRRSKVILPPIFVMSADPMISNPEYLQEYGFDDYIQKPASMADLFQKLNVWFEAMVPHSY